MSFTSELYAEVKEFSGEKMDAAIRNHYSEELAEKLVGKSHHDRVDDDPAQWDESEGPIQVDPGFFLYASEIDWDSGRIRCEWISPDGSLGDAIFPSEGLFASEFERPDYEAELYGLSFSADQIELLLPNLRLKPNITLGGERHEVKRSIGRPKKWDWEGALAFIVSQAQTPDGLPTGDGAQARIEEAIRNWFIDQKGDSPASSQIRQRASSIIKALEKPETPLNN